MKNTIFGYIYLIFSYFGEAQGGGSFGKSAKSSIWCPLGGLREGYLLR